MNTGGDPTVAVRALQARLRELQRPSGAWAAGPEGPDAVEPTALAVLALGLCGGDQQVTARGLRWLTTIQRPDGSWPATAQVEAPSWAGAVALHTLARLRAGAPNVARGVAWLGAREALTVDRRTALLLRFERWRGAQVPTTLDVTLMGWPWADGTFSWVEPTSVALLALRSAFAMNPALARDRRLRDRVSSAERMLVDRATPGGGWNYGNTTVLGQDVAPYPDTTAWALLALGGVAGNGVATAVSAALAQLPAMLAATRSSLAHSLGALALRAHRRSDTAVRDALDARIAVQGPPAEVRVQALTLLALAGPPLPFRA